MNWEKSAVARWVLELNLQVDRQVGIVCFESRDHVDWLIYRCGRSGMPWLHGVGVYGCGRTRLASVHGLWANRNQLIGEVSLQTSA